MKDTVVGIFRTREDAENAITELHNDLDLDNDDISYVYKNIEGNVQEVTADKITDHSPARGAKRGAVVGGTIGGALGLATALGVIPVIGPVLAAGPLLTALGIGAGAVGTTAAGAVTGAAAGGLIGALTNLGVDRNRAKEYEDRVRQGDILVAAHTQEAGQASKVLSRNGAFDVNVYQLAM